MLALSGPWHTLTALSANMNTRKVSTRHMVALQSQSSLEFSAA